MRIIVFDTETTERYPGKICQLSYIMKDDNAPPIGKNFYFTVPYVNPEAQAVHGLSVEALKRLSKGKVFKDFAEEINSDFISADLLIAHNFNFDRRFMQKEFVIALKQCFSYGKVLDTMDYFTPIMKMYSYIDAFEYKAPKLEELAMYLNINEKHAMKVCAEIFGSEDIGFHDARYDIVVTYLCYVQAVREGFMTKGGDKIEKS